MKISLALGGGGSKGIAHIGVLRCLEREGVHVAAIAGTSAGGIVAALYAAGYSPDEILERLKKLDFSQMYRHDPGDRPSLLGVAGVKKVISEMLGDRRFSELRIPAALVSVDLRSGKEVVLCEGCVGEAILATIALPGILPPVEIDQYFLVDGGILNPVPVAPARALAPKLPVLAVVLNSLPVEPREMVDPPRIIQNIPLVSQFSRLRLGQALNIFIRSIELGGSFTSELRLQIDKPDVIIRPEVSEIGLFDHVEIDQVVRLGENATLGILPDLRRTGSWHRILSRYLFNRS